MDVSTGKPQSKCFPKFWGKKSQCTLWHFSIDILFQIALLVMEFLFFSLSYHMQNQSKISVSNTIFENLSKQMIGISPDLFLKGCDVIRRKHSRFFQSYRDRIETNIGLISFVFNERISKQFSKYTRNLSTVQKGRGSDAFRTQSCIIQCVIEPGL